MIQPSGHILSKGCRLFDFTFCFVGNDTYGKYEVIDGLSTSKKGELKEASSKSVQAGFIRRQHPWVCVLERQDS